MRGAPVALSAREFALLEALLARPGAILSRAQLEEKLYGWNEEVESNAVEVHLHALRRKLGADTIRNVRGVGWMIAADAARRPPGSIAGDAHRTAERRTTESAALDPPELLVWLSAGLLVAVASPRSRRTCARARKPTRSSTTSCGRWRRRSPASRSPAARPGSRVGGDALVVQIWDRNGVQVFVSQPQQPLPQHGAARLQHGGDAERRMARVQRARRRAGRAGRAADERAARARRQHGAAHDRAAAAIVPPLLALLRLVRHRARAAPARARRRRRRRARRRARSSPVAEAGLPTEVRPLVAALNGLLGAARPRARRAARIHRRRRARAAHAAHRRAPAGAARRARDDRRRARARRSPSLRAGLDRATHLVEQLLTLAREEPGVSERPFAPVNLAELARSVVADHAAIAAARGVDLGMVGRSGRRVGRRRSSTATPPALRALVSNLVDNAVRYTPAGGRVDVDASTRRRRRVARVRDSGPAFRRAERDARLRPLLPRRRRSGADVAGSGLGLAIVKRDRRAPRRDHRARARACSVARHGEGLGVTVRHSDPGRGNCGPPRESRRSRGRVVAAVACRRD